MTLNHDVDNKLVAHLTPLIAIHSAISPQKNRVWVDSPETPSRSLLYKSALTATPSGGFVPSVVATAALATSSAATAAAYPSL